MHDEANAGIELRFCAASGPILEAWLVDLMTPIDPSPSHQRLWC